MIETTSSYIYAKCLRDFSLLLEKKKKQVVAILPGLCEQTSTFFVLE